MHTSRSFTQSITFRSLLLPLFLSICSSNAFDSFAPAIPQLPFFDTDPIWQQNLPQPQPQPQTQTQSQSHNNEIFKRADNCPAGSGSCAYMGYPKYCCKGNANCAIDSVGHVACCPVGAQCTGTIAGAFATRGSSTANGDSNNGQTTSTTATLVPAAQATGDFSVVPNPYYPFRAIPTTYANAAGCSAAWTGCQTDMARCTAYLQGQQLPSTTGGGGGGGVVTANGVTISAPNGGVTVNGQTTDLLPSVTITMAPASASSICSSLSQAGCSGLQVTACSLFGGGASNDAGRACGGYGAAFGGAAVGLAGQLLLV